MAAPSETEAAALPKEEEKPKIEPLRLPTVEEIQGQDIWNNCAIRSAVSGIMGGGFGLFMGLLLGAVDNPIMQQEMTAKQQFIHTARQMGSRSMSSAKTFAVMGLIFSAAECVVEKARAKHDMTNTVVAGCVTGGAISAKGQRKWQSPPPGGSSSRWGSFPSFMAPPLLLQQETSLGLVSKGWSEGGMCWMCWVCRILCRDREVLRPA